MIDPKDEVALAEAITGLLMNPAHRHELVAHSIQQASKFSWESSAGKVAEACKMAFNLIESS